eukprot:g39348.t1
MSDASVVSSSSLTDNHKESDCSLDSHQKKILYSYSTATSVHAFDDNSTTECTWCEEHKRPITLLTRNVGKHLCSHFRTLLPRMKRTYYKLYWDTKKEIIKGNKPATGELPESSSNSGSADRSGSSSITSSQLTRGSSCSCSLEIQQIWTPALSEEGSNQSSSNEQLLLVKQLNALKNNNPKDKDKIYASELALMYHGDRMH